MKNLFNNDLNQTELFKQPANNENFDEIERALNSKREQRVLTISFVFCIVLAILGLIFGVRTHSSAIIFDALVSLINSVLTLFSAVTARLVHKQGNDNFQFGFGGLENMTNILKALVLIGICVYGFFTGLGALVNGGRETEQGDAFLFNVLCFIVALGLFFYERYWARRLGSGLIGVDSLEWFSDILLYLGAGVAFGLSVWFNPSWAHLVDPALLCVLSSLIIIAPIWVLIKNAAQLLLYAPQEFCDDVENIMQTICDKYGFIDYRRRVGSQGRFYFLVLDLLIPAANDLRVSELDTLRDEIKMAIENKIKDEKELNIIISFTHERKWARVD